MTNRIFKEVEPGLVAHTAASRVLAENVAMDDWVGLCLEDIMPVRTSIFTPPLTSFYEHSLFWLRKPCPGYNITI